MGMQLFKEKREYPRMDINCLVRTKEELGKAKQLIGINYSLRGMALYSYSPLPFGEFVELNFRLDEYKKQELHMTAEVVQNYKKGNMYIAGVKFVGELPLDS